MIDPDQVPNFAPTFLDEWRRLFAAAKAADDYRRAVLAPLGDLIARLGVPKSAIDPPPPPGVVAVVGPDGARVEVRLAPGRKFTVRRDVASGAINFTSQTWIGPPMTPEFEAAADREEAAAKAEAAKPLVVLIAEHEAAKAEADAKRKAAEDAENAERKARYRVLRKAGAVDSVGELIGHDPVVFAKDGGLYALKLQHERRSDEWGYYVVPARLLS